MFASYAMFARRGAFRRYLIGSPSSNAVDKVVFRPEVVYATNNTSHYAAPHRSCARLWAAPFV